MTVRLFVVVLAASLISACYSEQDAEKFAAAASAEVPTVVDADEFIAKVNDELQELNVEQARTLWVQQTYITDDTAALAAKVSEKSLAFQSRIVEDSKAFNGLDLDGATGRAMKLIKLGSTMPAPNDEAQRSELANIAVELESMYGKGSYCPDGDDSCKSLGELEDIIAKSRDYDELVDAWAGWRTISPPMRPMYQRFVELTNAGSAELGFADLGTLWRSGYDMDADAFEQEAERLWTQVKPLYEELHCHVRAELAKEYGEDKVSLDGPIPAHLLGNMWSQQWNNIYDLLEPYPGVADLNVTQTLESEGYDAEQMTRLAEEFFTSLGMPELPDSFWQRSMLTKPRDRDVVCHPSAWPMDGKEDVRIKGCLDPTEEDLFTIYHELGHIYYFLLYKEQTPMFQGGAHDGFHEAIGDTIVLSMTPEYLRSVGLVGEVERNNQAVINQQMKMALEKIAFLPFGKLVDQWRWDVFSGKVQPADYNKAWWALRTKYQGIQAPVPRTEDDFDPGAKYHVPGNTPYTRYFLSFIMQFQFHRSLCEIAGYDGPLHECSIYGNENAGERFSAMMSLGAGQPWPDALEKLTGTRKMDATAIIDYFQPLMMWLRQQNQVRNCGW